MRKITLLVTIALIIACFESCDTSNNNCNDFIQACNLYGEWDAAFVLTCYANDTIFMESGATFEMLFLEDKTAFSYDCSAQIECDSSFFEWSFKDDSTFSRTHIKKVDTNESIFVIDYEVIVDSPDRYIWEYVDTFTNFTSIDYKVHTYKLSRK